MRLAHHGAGTWELDATCDGMDVSDTIATWRREEKARAQRSRAAFQLRIAKLASAREAKIDVLRQRRYQVEGQIGRVESAMREASEEVRRVIAAGRVPVSKAATRGISSAKATAAAMLGTTPSRPREGAGAGPGRTPGARLVPELGSKVVVSPKQTSSQLLEWLSTGRQPKRLAQAALSAETPPALPELWGRM